MYRCTIPPYKEGTFLIVSTVRLTDEHIKAFRLEFEENAQQLETKISPLILNRLSKRSEGDTAGDLYELASHAKNLGWKKFYVLDSASRRLLSDQEDTWEIDDDRSFGIVVETQWHGRHGKRGALTRATESAMFAWRTSIAELVQGIHGPEFEQRPDELNEYITDHEEFPNRDRMNRFVYGYELLNPHTPLTSPTMPEMSAKQRLRSENERLQIADATLTKVAELLPLELRTRIADYAEQGLSLDQLTPAPPVFKWTEKNIHIQLTSPVTDCEFEALQHEFSNRVKMEKSDFSCTLHRWLGIQPASFAQIWSIWKRLLERNSELTSFVTLFFVYATDWEKDRTKVSMVSTLDPYYPALRRPTLRKALNYLTIYHDMRDGPEYLEPSRDIGYEDLQIFPDPQYPFYPFQPWPAFSSGGSCLNIPLFYLTKNITSENIVSLDKEVEEFSEEYAYDPPVKYCHIFWEKEEPGDWEDAYKILHNIRYKTVGVNTPDMADKYTCSFYFLDVAHPTT